MSMEANTELEELTALFEEDGLDTENEIDNHEDSNIFSSKDSSGDSCNELHDIEEEYQQLQKKMLLLQEKMKLKKKFSPDFSAKTVSEGRMISQSSSDSSITPDKESAQKRSFCEAFGFALNSTTNDCNGSGQESVKKINGRKAVVETSEKSAVGKGNSFYPSQKKSKISHASQTLFTKPGGLSKSKFSRTPDQQQKMMIETEIFSKIRLKKRFLDSNDLKESMEGKLFLKPSLIRPTMNISEDRDWVTIGVVAKHGDPQTAKNGKKFVIWHLSGLDDCTKVVSLFLFGKVYEELGKAIPIGMVIGLLNPTIMPPKKDDSSKNFNNSTALTIDVSERLTKIGLAADLGWCNATKFRNKQPAGKCLAIINKQYGNVCVFHMKASHKKMSAKRGELQGTTGSAVPAKYKHTMWNQVKGEQFFYAGQTYSAAPPSAGRSAPRKESKMKLTDILGDNRNVSVSEQNAEMERSKIMRAISGIEEKQSLSGCSDKFAEMLASGDNVAGSRQFLNHLQKKKRAAVEATPATGSSAADVLKQQKTLFEDRNKKTSTSSSISKKSLTAAEFLNEQTRRGKYKTNSHDETSKTCKSNSNMKSIDRVRASPHDLDANSTSYKNSQSTVFKNRITETKSYPSCSKSSLGAQLPSDATRRLTFGTEREEASRRLNKELDRDAKASASNVTDNNGRDKVAIGCDTSSAIAAMSGRHGDNRSATTFVLNTKQTASCGNGASKSAAGNETSQSPREVLLQMKRERYLKRKENRKEEKICKSQSPLLLPSSSPKLGGEQTGSDVNLFGDWMIQRHSSRSTSAPSLAELRKKKALDKLRNQSGQIQIESRDPNRPLVSSSIKSSTNEVRKRRLEEKVAANRKDLIYDNKENNKSVKTVFSKLSEKEFQKILKASSSHQYELDLEEMERQEAYFNPLIKKEMMEMKMSQTYEIPAKTVTCHQCNYTYWAAHERCKSLHHDLAWKDVKKKYFECGKCKHRTITWHPYPLKACRECGSEKLWRRTCMWKAKEVKLESETLLVRGMEHSKFLNSIKSGDW